MHGGFRGHKPAILKIAKFEPPSIVSERFFTADRAEKPGDGLPLTHHVWLGKQWPAVARPMWRPDRQ
jgi:hypothetical protein